MKKNLCSIFLCFTFVMLHSQSFNQFDADGNRHGKWRKMYEGTDQVRYEGQFDHGKEIGTFNYYKPSSGDQPTAIKQFSKSSDTASVQYFTSKGNVISEGKMVGKQRVGKWKYYHNGSNNVMMTEFYSAGQLDGPQLTYYENGQIAESLEYKQGTKEGRRLSYSEDGVLLKDISYNNDKQHGPALYYETNGTIKIEGAYKNNKKDGMWRYYQNGKLKEEKKYPIYTKRKPR